MRPRRGQPAPGRDARYMRGLGAQGLGLYFCFFALGDVGRCAESLPARAVVLEDRALDGLQPADVPVRVGQALLRYEAILEGVEDLLIDAAEKLHLDADFNPNRV